MAFVSQKCGSLASTFCRRFNKLIFNKANSISSNVMIKINSISISTQNILFPVSFLQHRHYSTKLETKKELVTLKFVKADGEVLTAKSKVGDNLLDVIIDNDIDIDGFGACEGTLACSTCHLIFKDADYNSIPEKPTDEELDMLDLAYALTDTSRLGCQVIVTKAMEGWEIQVPQGVADAREP